MKSYISTLKSRAPTMIKSVLLILIQVDSAEAAEAQKGN